MITQIQPIEDPVMAPTYNARRLDLFAEETCDRESCRLEEFCALMKSVVLLSAPSSFVSENTSFNNVQSPTVTRITKSKLSCFARTIA